MEHLSYIEVNIVCILLLAIVFFKQFSNRSIVSSSQIYMKNLILTSCILCSSDILAMACRGQNFNGARIMIEISNLIYFEAMPLISMLWLKYVLIKTNRKISKKINLMLYIPIVFFTIVAVSNPFTQILFSIDESNLYVRGPGVFLHWIVSWLYLITAAIASYKAYKNSKGWNQKNEYRPLLIFIILPAICCLIQMLLYGVSAVQAGIALSIVMVNFQMLDNRISIDELTGVNNRKELMIYVDKLINRYKAVSLCVVMIDVNRFKQINDTLGHNVGDMALQDVSSALKSVCTKFGENIFLSRYGGDEFVLIVRDVDESKVNELNDLIHNLVKQSAVDANRPYELSVAVGYSIEKCESLADFEKCIKCADDAMYVEKELAKSGATV